jgi:hypothetical protein
VPTAALLPAPPPAPAGAAPYLSPIIRWVPRSGSLGR